MADTVDKATRSRMMAAIRGRNTKPEIAVRKALHRLGFRYVLHSTKLSGSPDIVFPSRNAVIFVHGCFWHGHNCHVSRIPKTRREFWKAKIVRNRKRDRKVRRALAVLGWRQLVIWECAIRGRNQEVLDTVVNRAALWLRSNDKNSEIRELR